MEELGWFKVDRKIFLNPIVCKDSDHFATWMYLVGNATHKKMDAIFQNRRITLMPGQLITGRKSIAVLFGISESKVQRILKTFEIEHQIEQQTSSQNRLVTIVNWKQYQQSEQQNEQQVNNKWTASEQQVNTNKNVRNSYLFINNKEEQKNSNDFCPFTEGDEYSQFLKAQGIKSKKEYMELPIEEQDRLAERFILR